MAPDVFDFQEKSYEYKVLKLFMTDLEFCKSFITHLKPEYFSNPVLQVFAKILVKYYNKYNTVPTFEYFKNERPKQIPEDLYNSELKKLEQTTLLDSEYTEHLFIDFCKRQLMKNIILSAPKLMEQKDYARIEDLMRQAITIGEDWKNLGLEYFKDYTRFNKKRDEEYLPTLIEQLDSALGGGLACRSLGVLLGATGVGKTAMLVNLCKAALLQQVSSVYYTLELSAEKIALRFDCSFLGKTRAQILSHFRKSEEALRSIYEQKILGAELIIKEYPTGSASVDDIRTHLLMLEKMGKNIGAIFVDYAEIMKARTSDEFRFKMKEIYEGLRGIAVEFNIPVWTAHQTTRDALEKMDISLKDVSEAHWVSNIVDVMIAIVQTQEERQKSTFRLRVLKNRDGVLPNRDVVILADYSKMIIQEQNNEE